MGKGKKQIGRRKRSALIFVGSKWSAKTKVGRNFGWLKFWSLSADPPGGLQISYGGGSKMRWKCAVPKGVLHGLWRMPNLVWYFYFYFCFSDYPGSLNRHFRAACIRTKIVMSLVWHRSGHHFCYARISLFITLSLLEIKSPHAGLSLANKSWPPGLSLLWSLSKVISPALPRVGGGTGPIWTAHNNDMEL